VAVQVVGTFAFVGGDRPFVRDHIATTIAKAAMPSIPDGRVRDKPKRTRLLLSYEEAASAYLRGIRLTPDQ
jgi:hypothetical protein